MPDRTSQRPLLCSWCDDAATYHLLADVDSHDNVHTACDTHEAQWGRLYRRSVSVAHHPVVDLRGSIVHVEARGTVA